LNALFSGKLIIASRQSRLAMWQAEHVRDRLLALYPQCTVEILGMTTRGDQILDRTLSKVGGKGLFVKELELALAEGRADLAVHSLKDVPMELPEGFELAAVLEREDARDAFVSNRFATLADLPAGSVVGTSSLRRQALIAARFPDLKILPLRGNVDTRLGKLDGGEYAAIILAAAGLKRLGLENRITELLDPAVSLPAPGQGAMAIEIAGRRENTNAHFRADSGFDLRDILAPLNHLPTARAVTAERTLSRTFGGSCQIPLAAYAVIEPVAATADDGQAGAAAPVAQMTMRALVATPDGLRMAEASARGPADQPEALGSEIARLLVERDVEDILKACR
jgi:hydroxymethylbilane synthase